ncbi:MATE family efflux transporter [Bacillus alkalisoli]|uniref:hypothetical protein n=1 Tax=Bacillus alkalisoli TaxID=2011008 RepID=UPI000C24046F|nr:hypothetical protein [Bacillus alkalisoli]
MNSKARKFFKNFSYAITANITSLIISVLIVLIVPKLIGVEDYGYWQLYLFYVAYVGFLQFGWNDGIYLRYGGMEYNKLEKKVFFSQFWMLTISQLILSIIIIVFSSIFINEVEREFILIMVSFCMVLMGVRAMPMFILQATNRIKEYSQMIIMDRLLYCCLVIALLIFGVREYELIIVADLIGKFVSLLYAVYSCRDLIFNKVNNFYLSFNETIENISVGIKLMFANIASMLIIGVVRFGIERSWDIATFGKVSLTLSISKLLMLFINSVGIILFPILRKTEMDRLPNIYKSMRDLLMVILFGVLILYYPLSVMLSSWLPDYAESVLYLALLFPMCVYEGKTALLINTFLKTLRKEKLMLKINLISLFLSVNITLLTTMLIENLNLAILSIVFILAFRSILAEILISKILGVSIFKDILLELLLSSSFILAAWFIDSWLFTVVYGVIYLLYLLLKRNDLIFTTKQIQSLIKA